MIAADVGTHVFIAQMTAILAIAVVSLAVIVAVFFDRRNGGRPA